LIHSAKVASEKKTLKFALIGDPGAGKTSLITRWTEKVFKEIVPGIGDDKNSGMCEFPSTTITVQEQSYKVVLMDGSAWCKPEFKRVENPFQEIDGIFLCYDISTRQSFDALEKKWRPILSRLKVLDQKAIIIVGCKGDLVQVIDTSLIPMIMTYADDDVVTSAKTGEKADDALSIMTSCTMNNSKVQKTKPENSKIWKQLVDSTRGDVGYSPHTFKLKFFTSPTWCDFCQNFIWGVISPQGYCCQVCGYTTHKKCMGNVPHMCEVE